MLAELPGALGTVRVEERDGLRLLTVGGVVQGAAPIEGAGEVAAADPLVALVRAARPEARTALVIGLGTGRTAAELTAAGLDVEVIELDPAVIALARRFFGYRGHAAAGDGLARLRDGARPDVVIVDAFAGGKPPPELVEVIRARTDDPGLVAIRLVGEPGSERLTTLRRQLRTVYFPLAFGSGVGGEAQNLYVLASGAPINLVHPIGLAAWPLFESLEERARPDAAAVPGSPAARRITLLGYLVRAREDGALCLDLPHQEMGALRYRLTGANAARLAALLPAGFQAPTAGDIGSDGDTTATLREIYGGGGWKRSDVRFSPVLVAVDGVATVDAVIHPDAASSIPARHRGDVATDPRLPWGGVLYDLEVLNVLFTYDRAAWQRRAKLLAPVVAAVVRAVDEGKLDRAGAELEACLKAMEQDAGVFARRLTVYTELAGLRRALAAEASGAASGFDRGAGCDRAREATGFGLGATSAPGRAVMAGLGRCAERGYRKALATESGARKGIAVGRLLSLIERRGYESPVDLQAFKRAANEIEALSRAHPGIEPLGEPPAR